MAGREIEKGSTEATNSSPSVEATAVTPGGMHARVLATGPNVGALIELMRAAPQATAQIMAAIAQNFGNSVVQQTRTAQAKGGSGTGTVIASQLNVRSAPAKTDENVLGQLNHGAPVDVVAKHGPWLEVPYSGQNAFVAGEWIKQADTDTSATPKDPGAYTETHTPAQAAESPTPIAPISDVGATSSTPPSASASSASAPPVATPSPVAPIAPTTAAATPHAMIHQGAATFETIEHTKVEVHQAGEGKVLSDIRAFKQQFDPHWLKQLQTKLQVGDATGAFNTETLRAMRDVTGEKLSAAKITSQAFLDALGKQFGVDGEPFLPEVDAKGHAEPDLNKTDPADIAAQAIGYADYDTYYEKAMHRVTFLGVRLDQNHSDGRAHPLLASRIAAAEAYLVQRFGSNEKAIAGTGWSKQGNAAYGTDSAAHDPKDPKSHMHTMGMAMDIDAGTNPYTMPKGDNAGADWITWFYQTGFELGHRLGFGGDALNLESLYGEGKNMSSEELHEHMLASSKSFARTVELSEKSDEEIKAALQAAKPPFADGAGEKDIPALIEKWFHPAKKVFHDSKSGARKFHETMTESKELVVALRDAAGLNWGGTEMSAGQNGDFMHFDTRNDSTGNTVFQAGFDAQRARKAKAKETKSK